MTAEEYLRQAYRLDQRINSDLEELSRLHEMAVSTSAPVPGEKVQTTRNTEAPFVSAVEKIMAQEEYINGEVDLLVDLREQIRKVIGTVPDPDERMVLQYRYIHGLTWKKISKKLCKSVSSVKRYHWSGLSHVTMPENPIEI